MKKTVIFFVIIFICNFSYSQTNSDNFGQLVISTYLPSNMDIPIEASKLLEKKLNQISTNSGVGGAQENPRFIITSSLSVLSKDVIAGPPIMISQNLELTLFIGDAINNTVFSSISVSLKGVGTNENKAFIEAIKSIDTKSKGILAFVEEGKNKIISYYSSKCDIIIKDALSLSKQDKYSEAIYNLMLIPDACKECFVKSRNAIELIYKDGINFDCKQKLQEAKNNWAANPNKETALLIASSISTISPSSSCLSEINILINSILKKVTLDETEKKEFELKVYTNNIEKEKENINLYKQLALEYIKSQPKTINTTNLIWK